MGKRIWIVNYYTGTPLTQSNPRYLKLARHFMDAGYEVLTFNSALSSRTLEEQRQNAQPFLERTYGDYRFVHINAPAYQGNGIRRMFSIWKFAVMMKRAAKRFPRPDIILHNIHPPFDYPVVKLVKNLKAKYIAEAWDLWPEDFVTFGLVKAKNPLMKIAYSIEKKYYYAADEIVFTFLGAFDYLKRQGWMKDQGGKIDPAHLHYINNGIDLDQFDIDKTKYTRPDPDLNDPSLKKIIYLGSINKANNVKALIDAAALFEKQPEYRFFIYGNGAYRPDLMQYVSDNRIDNVVFKEERIPFAECAWVVSQATVNVMNYEKGFGRWGVSSGKMFQYLAAGKPIICNIDIAYDNVIQDNHLGIARDISTPEGFAEAIRRLAEQSREDYDAMCARVRETACRFDYKILAAEEIKLLESCKKLASQ
ncbi:MAG: glycosyltransferase family 4 protein [Candidatus Cryptobacteroides sp.]|jgi:glycosyltransferase involved in cell wall biosynthesis